MSGKLFIVATGATVGKTYPEKTETRKKGIKESTRFNDAYITADYAKAIQGERRMLIKVMFKAKEQGSEAKVVGRYLYIGELKYDVTNIPEDLRFCLKMVLIAALIVKV